MIRKTTSTVLAAAATATIVWTAAAGAAPTAGAVVTKTTIAGTIPATTSPIPTAGPPTSPAPATAPTSPTPATAVPTTSPPDTVPDGFVRLTDDTRRIRVTVPDTWTDIETTPAMSDDGRDRPKIVAAPDITAMNESWTTPGVWFGVVPAPTDPISWLDAYGFGSQCSNGGSAPFDNGRVAGVEQSWINCGGGSAAVIQVAATAPDGSFGAFIQIQALSPDDGAIDVVLSSFGLVPGAAITAPSAVNSSTVTTVGPSDPDLVAAVPPDARRVVDDTGRLAMSVPATFTEDDPTPDLNDDASARPYIAAAPDLTAHRAEWAAVGVQAVLLPYNDPATVLANRDLPSCTDGGVRPYANGTFTGLAQTWTECAGTGARVIQAVVSPADSSASVMVYAQLPDADNTPIAVALASLELL